jgi:tetratricopeptide (TPR) repeat protein
MISVGFSMIPVGRRSLAVIGGCLFSILLIAGLAGCSRDPEVRKRNYLNKGNAYFERAKYSEAMIEYQNAIQIDPKFADAHYGLAKCFLRQRDWDHAYSELSHAVEYQPTDWQAQLALGDLLLSGGQALDARNRAQTVLDGDPNNAEAEVLLAGADATLGILPKAIEEAKSAVRMNPNRSASYDFLAGLQERNKDIPSAQQNYEKAVSVDPKSLSAILALGRFYVRQNQSRDAEKQFQAAITVNPLDPAPRGMLAELYLSEGQKGMAEQVLQSARNTLKDNPAGYRMLGDFYSSQGAWDKAAAEFASLHSEHPKDDAVAKSYVDSLIHLNRFDEATKINDALLKNSGSDPIALILRGEILLRQGKSTEAIPPLTTAIKDAPDNSMGHYYLGLAYLGSSNFGQAQSEWQEAARLDPKVVEPQRALATLALRQRDFSLLADTSQKLTELEPNSPEGYIFHAESLAANGDTAGAETDLRKAIAIAPRDPIPLTRMGELLMAEKQFDQASNFYSQALTLDASSLEALAGLVNIDLERKQPAQALRRLQDQLARVPASSGLYTLLGQVEAQNQDAAKAEDAFQKAVDLNTNNTEALLLLANAEVARGAVDQAIATYKRGLQDNPREVRLYVALAHVLEGRDWQQSEDFYQKALQVQPDYPVAANNLAYLMLEHDGNVNVALTLAQTGRRGMPNDPSTADTLGWAYYHQGAYNSAIDTLQQAVNENPKNPTFHYHLGLAYEKTNNYPMAKKQLEYTLQISPDYPEAGEIRKMLSQSQ